MPEFGRFQDGPLSDSDAEQRAFGSSPAYHRSGADEDTTLAELCGANV
jgi:hypothetical protein